MAATTSPTSDAKIPSTESLSPNRQSVRDIAPFKLLSHSPFLRPSQPDAAKLGTNSEFTDPGGTIPLLTSCPPSPGELRSAPPLRCADASYEVAEGMRRNGEFDGDDWKFGGVSSYSEKWDGRRGSDDVGEVETGRERHGSTVVIIGTSSSANEHSQDLGCVRVSAARKLWRK
ncbi:hypothetical protein K469DRAFT_760051 [Zopfia rhizophila CBS 207.26]|uniref:Uncharacterized protein n=1 Tax=Zopfia rhizophila CBS 207.26 TaxID=1314779 RepID=A0A6A6EI74_9PEZI|nr:hypothetical protein K469DRAFT_760051 [Zopfia rhizophila CBS 207.26]